MSPKNLPMHRHASMLKQNHTDIIFQLKICSRLSDFKGVGEHFWTKISWHWNIHFSSLSWWTAASPTLSCNNIVSLNFAQMCNVVPTNLYRKPGFLMWWSHNVSMEKNDRLLIFQLNLLHVMERLCSNKIVEHWVYSV